MTPRLPVSLVALIVAATFAAAPAPAQPAPREPTRVVATAGEGRIEVQPDMATITLGTRSEARAARDASEANAKVVSEIIKQMRELGLESRDIQTRNFSVSPVFAYTSGREQPPRVTGYQVSNLVTIRLRDLTKVGDALERAIAAGANQVHGLQFGVSNQGQKLDEARARAVADAKRKAELYLQGAGAPAKLGRVLTITESGAQVIRPRGLPMAAESMGRSAAPAPPVEAGEETLTVNVNVTWEIVD